MRRPQPPHCTECLEQNHVIAVHGFFDITLQAQGDENTVGFSLQVVLADAEFIG